jgi:hypothetical protein
MNSNESPKPIDYASMLAAMEAQRAALDAAIPTMRVLASLSGALISEGMGGSAFNQSQTLIAPGEVPPGSFHAMSIPKAAVLYLRMVKQKQKASDIANALKRGGIFTQSSDFNNQVHAALDRAAKAENAEILKLHDAFWALREWFPANVRASMASGPPPKKNKKNKKRKTAVSATPEIKPETAKPEQERKPQVSNIGTSVPSPKAPEGETTEGRILAAMRTDIKKEWTPAEITAAARIERAQTAPFLLGKMAFRGLVHKTESGAYKIVLGSI